MKKLLFLIFFFVTSPAFAQWQEARMNVGIMGGGVTAAGCTSVTVDVDERLEAVPTDGVGGWTVVDTASKISASATGEKATISCAGGTADTGTNGIADNANSTTAGYIQRTFTSTDTISIGFWYKPTYAWNMNYRIASIYASATEAVYLYNYWDSNKIYLYAHGSTNSGNCEMTDGAWIYITLQRNNEGTNSLTVYNAAGAVQCAASEFTDGGQGNSTSVALGCVADCVDADVVNYYDDLWIDITDATYPLGP